jgi:hypothetical protein
LQAADLLAHLSYRHMRERHKEDKWGPPPTGLLATCLKNSKDIKDHQFFDRESLRQMLDLSAKIFGVNWDN